MQQGGEPRPDRRTALTVGSLFAASLGALPALAAVPDTFGRPLKTVTTVQTPSLSIKELVRSKKRLQTVAQVFPNAEFADAWVADVIKALSANGITGQNAIAIIGLCRDESNGALRDQLEDYFGPSFSAHGLGGFWGMGVTGMKAATSHSPLEGSKPRYVFVAMPHIAVARDGTTGKVARPGRGISGACGALSGALKALKGSSDWSGLMNPAAPSMQVDPEETLIISKMATAMKDKELDLVTITKVAEQMITQEVEKLIAATVNPSEADYAVITGIQVHSTCDSVSDEDPTLEFVVPGTSYAMVGGAKKEIQLSSKSSLNRLDGKLLALLDSYPDAD